MNDPANEKWNENIETCSDCGIHWKKIGKSCPVCYARLWHPLEKNRKVLPGMLCSYGTIDA
jgi:predicted amidophosphoribosyltransferase